MKHFEKLLAAPMALQKKLACMMLIGMGMGAVGVAIHLAMDDPMLLILSLALTISCIVKAVFLGKIILGKRYIVIEGRCVSTAPLPFSRFAQVILCNGDGEEHICRLEKRMKIKVGQRMTLYFAMLPQSGIGVAGIDALLNTDSLLAFETQHYLVS